MMESCITVTLEGRFYSGEKCKYTRQVSLTSETVTKVSKQRPVVSVENRAVSEGIVVCAWICHLWLFRFRFMLS